MPFSPFLLVIDNCGLQCVHCQCGTVYVHGWQAVKGNDHGCCLDGGCFFQALECLAHLRIIPILFDLRQTLKLLTFLPGINLR